MTNTIDDDNDRERERRPSVVIRRILDAMSILPHLGRDLVKGLNLVFSGGGGRLAVGPSMNKVIQIDRQGTAGSQAANGSSSGDGAGSETTQHSSRVNDGMRVAYSVCV